MRGKQAQPIKRLAPGQRLRGPSQGLTPDPSHVFNPNVDLIEQPASVRAHQRHPGRVFPSVSTHSTWERLCRQPVGEPLVQPGCLADGQREAQNHKAGASVSLGLRWDPHAHLAGCLGDQKGPCIYRVCSQESGRQVLGTRLPTGEPGDWPGRVHMSLHCSGPVLQFSE